MQRYFENGGRGEVLYASLDVILAETDVVQPDLVVVGMRLLPRYLMSS